MWNMTGTPAVATVVLGGLAALAALLIQLEVLVEMMSIGMISIMMMMSLHERRVTEDCDCKLIFSL